MNALKPIALHAILVPAITLFGSQAMAQTAADVKIEGAWIRTAVAGQSGTGGFMKLTAPAAMKLVGTR
jgi:periplasmic copper chaperone A